MPPPPLAAVAELLPLLPRETGLLVFYSASGAFGGVVAAAHAAGIAPPSLWAIVKALLIGAGLGFAAGNIGLWKFGADGGNFFLNLGLSFGLGFSGPGVAQKLIKGALAKGTTP